MLLIRIFNLYFIDSGASRWFPDNQLDLPENANYPPTSPSYNYLHSDDDSE
jgi:hypothetical protein